MFELYAVKRMLDRGMVVTTLFTDTDMITTAQPLPRWPNKYDQIALSVAETFPPLVKPRRAK